MDYATDVPPGYKNWVSFYEAVKPYLLNGVDDIHWHMPLTSLQSSAAPVELQDYKYSARYIEQQTLAELYKLRKLQTFDFEECRLLDQALQLATNYWSGEVDPGIRALQAKVDLFYKEFQK